MREWTTAGLSSGKLVGVACMKPKVCPFADKKMSEPSRCFVRPDDALGGTP